MPILDNLDRWIRLANAFRASIPDIKRVVEYFLRFEHITVVNPLTADPREVIVQLGAAIRRFREMAGLRAGEDIDPQMLAKLTDPRCGCSDALRATAEARWRKNKLTYFVASYVNGLSRADQDDLLRLAWKDWTDVANLTLTQVASQAGADIVISTGRGAAQNFDGGGGTLAWAYLPTGNDQPLLMRFDNDERWLRDNPQGGILFRNVACHEFGHLLGLEHSRVSSALMAPFYSPSVIKPQADDVQRIQAMYGPATATPPPPPAPPPTDKVTVTLEVQGKNVRVLGVV